MISNAGELSENQVLDADICIVGGGAAGITMALELIGSGLKVVLLEAGQIGFDDQAQSLYQGPNLGFPVTSELDDSRLRMLGGSTNHWAGNCMPLAPIDFEERPGVPHSGWPITRADLDPYYLRAQQKVETPSANFYDSAAYRDEIGFEDLAFDPKKLKSFVYAESPPTAFGYVYEDTLAQASNVQVFLNANVLEIETNDTASEVTGLRVAAIDGPSFRVQARRYVLAAGGIEIPRLLLLSNRVQTAGLGNDNDLVGRYFMDHISLRPPLTVMLPDAGAHLDRYTTGAEVAGGYLRGAIGASDDLLRAEALPNFLFFVFTDPNRSPGRRSAENLRRSLPKGQIPENLAMHIGNLLTDMDGVTNEIYRTLTGKSESLIERTWFEPWIVVESLPNPESRVKLIDERDAIFGQNKVGLDWQLDARDLSRNRRATEVLAEELGRLGYGRVWSELLADGSDWPGTVFHGKHHCGTTRMSDTPDTGVVDANCRMHGISNLYVASSSVFPTHGAATPTLTIVALSIRLADHLKGI